ncbi:unnamed protein product, partial [Meganyctiphanes norvegica]
HASCTFPFVYKNVKYTKCTDVDDQFYWCSYKQDENGHHIRQHWQQCQGMCGLLKNKNKTVEVIKMGKGLHNERRKRSLSTSQNCELEEVPDSCTDFGGQCSSKCPEDRIHVGSCSIYCSCCAKRCEAEEWCSQNEGYCVRKADHCDGILNDHRLGCKGKGCRCCLPSSFKEDEDEKQTSNHALGLSRSTATGTRKKKKPIKLTMDFLPTPVQCGPRKTPENCKSFGGKCYTRCQGSRAPVPDVVCSPWCNCCVKNCQTLSWCSWKGGYCVKKKEDCQGTFSSDTNGCKGMQCKCCIPNIHQEFGGPLENKWDQHQCLSLGEMESITIDDCMPLCDKMAICTAINYKISSLNCELLKCASYPFPKPTLRKT